VKSHIPHIHAHTHSPVPRPTRFTRLPQQRPQGAVDDGAGHVPRGVGAGGEELDGALAKVSDLRFGRLAEGLVLDLKVLSFVCEECGEGVLWIVGFWFWCLCVCEGLVFDMEVFGFGFVFCLWGGGGWLVVDGWLWGVGRMRGGAGKVCEPKATTKVHRIRADHQAKTNSEDQPNPPPSPIFPPTPTNPPPLHTHISQSQPPPPTCATSTAP
jgi:hypothetical protein